MAGEVNVGTLEAVLQLVDEVSPAAIDIDKVLEDLEEAVGVTREEVAQMNEEFANTARVGQLTDAALQALGISTDEYLAILNRQTAAADAAAAEMDKLHLEALKMNETMEKAGDPVMKFIETLVGGGSLQSAFTALMELPAGLVVGITALVKGVTMAIDAIKDFAGAVADLGKKAEQLENRSMVTGIDVETLQQWGRAADIAGVGAGRLDMAVVRMQRSIEGNGKALKLMGINLKEIENLKTADQIQLVANKLMGMSDAGQRNNAMMALMGRGGAQLLPLFKAIAEGAGETAVIMGKDTVEAAAKLDDAVDKLSGSWSDLKEQLVAAAAGGFPEAISVIDDLQLAIQRLAEYTKTNAPEIGGAIRGMLNHFTGGFIQVAIASIHKLADAQRRLAAGKELKENYEDAAKAAEDMAKAMDAAAKAGEDTIGLGPDEVKTAKASAAAIKEKEQALKAAVEAQKKAMDLRSRESEIAQAAVKEHTAVTESIMAAVRAQQALAAVSSGGFDDLTRNALAAADAMAEAGYGAEVIRDALLEAGVGADIANEKIAQLGPTLLETGEKSMAAASATEKGWIAAAQSLADGGKSADFIKEKLAAVGATSEQADAVLRAIGPTLEGNASKTAIFAGQGEKLAQKLQMAAQGAMMLANVLGGGLFADLAQGMSASISSFTQFKGSMKDIEDKYKGVTDKAGLAEKAKEKFAAKMDLASTAAGLLGGMLSKSTNATMQQAGAALQGAAAGAKMGASFGPIGAAAGAAIGGIMGWISAGKKMKAEVTKMYDEFVKAAGGLDALKQSAADAGVSLEEVMKNKGTKNVAQMKKAIEEAKEKMDAFKAVADKVGVSTMKELEAKAKAAGISMKEVFDAKTVEQYKAAMEKVGKQFDTLKEANEKLNTAMDKYGITIDQLGPKMRQQKLDEQAASLYEDWMLLIGAGVDMNVLIEKMGPAMMDYVNKAVAANATIPEAMKPTIDALYAQGKLLHENGQAYTQAEYEALKYGKTQAEMFDTLLEKITALVNALLGIPSEVNTNVNVNTRPTGGASNEPPEPPADQNGNHSYASGTMGFRDFGAGTAAILHGTERVQTAAQYKAETADIGGQVAAAINSQTSQLAKVFRDAVLKGV